MPTSNRGNTDAATKVLQALQALETATAKTIAAESGVAYSTVTAKLRALAARGEVTRSTDPDAGTTWSATARHPRREPTTDTEQTARRDDAEPSSTTPSDSKPDEGSDKARKPAPAAAGTPRRAKGELREQVLDLLRADPDTAYKVSELSKNLSASAGAVANAAHTLVHRGEARQTVTKPATFQAN